MSRMTTVNRRQFLHATTAFSLGTLAAGLPSTAEGTVDKRKMTICLSPGSIGVSANQKEAMQLAKRYGFEAVEPSPDFISKLENAALSELVGELKTLGLVFGTAGLS